MLKDVLNLRKVVAMAIFLAGSAAIMHAQDIITLRNGNDIQAVVNEVGVDEVRYKRFDNQSGPSYALKKSEIFMIKYENGTRDVFNETAVSASTFNQQINPYYSSSIYSQQELPLLNYTFGNQIDPYGDKKSAFFAGVLSFFVPGVGQFYNGDIGMGFVFLGANIASNAIWIGGSKYDRDLKGPSSNIGARNQIAVGLVCALVVNISSIINASKIAKRVNMARGYYYFGENTQLKIQPTMIQQNNFVTGNNKYTYGMSFRLNF